MTVTKLNTLGEQGTAQQINLSNYALWKLNYNVIKSYTPTSITLSDGTVINFTDAAGLVLSGSWSNARYNVTAYNGQSQVIGTNQSGAVGFDNTAAGIKSALETSSHVTYIGILAGGSDIGVTALEIDATGVYSQGLTAGEAIGAASVTVSRINQLSSSYNSSLHSYTLNMRATASNGATLEDTTTVVASDAYAQGWNAYRAQLVSTMGGKTNLCKSWTYRGNLYGAPQQGAAYYRDCYNGLTFADIPDAM